MNSKVHQYLVSFILDGQPRTEVLCTSEEELGVASALELLHLQLSEVDLSQLTDLQIQKRTRTEQVEGVPGHYRQP